jgi:hypothetical protein
VILSQQRLFFYKEVFFLLFFHQESLQIKRILLVKLLHTRSTREYQLVVLIVRGLIVHSTSTRGSENLNAYAAPCLETNNCTVQ